MAFNKMGPAGTAAIARSHAKELYLGSIFTNSLDGNNIGDAGAKSIGEAIKASTTLTCLGICKDLS